MTVTAIEASRLLWCPGLAQLTGSASGSVNQWIGVATYIPVSSGKELIFRNIDPVTFFRSLASDINRCATAASETLSNIYELERIPKSLGWPYVKLYYASLFYAHALLRIWGRFPSYLRTEELMPVRHTLAAYAESPPFKLETGQYLVKADIGKHEIAICVDKGSGGSHEAVWRELSRALLDLKKSVENAQYVKADRDFVVEQVKLLLGLISNNNKNVAWPSQMRNEIQYRQTEGVWYPYQGRKKTSDLRNEVEVIINGKGEFAKYLISNGDNITQFRSACFAIITFVREIIADMVEVGGSKSFLRFGLRKFEDYIRSM